MPLNNENNNDCCKCTTPQYELTLNQQGPQGKSGPQGEPGFSPRITVNTNTPSTYILTINTIDGQIVTPNLKANIPLGGQAGTVLTKNSGTDGDASWQILPNASQDSAGIVELATIDDLTPDESGEIDDLKAITPDLLSTYVEQKISNADNKYVTLNTSQTITGLKTFSNDTGILTNSIKEIENGSTIITYNTDASNILIGSTGNNTTDITLRTSSEGTLKYAKGPNTTYNIITSNDIATTTTAGIVKPDGSTITIDADGTIHSAGGQLPDNVLTSDNISQDAYIQQLEARIAALEALIDGGNANGNENPNAPSVYFDTIGNPTLTNQLILEEASNGNYLKMMPDDFLITTANGASSAKLRFKFTTGSTVTQANTLFGEGEEDTPQGATVFVLAPRTDGTDGPRLVQAMCDSDHNGHYTGNINLEYNKSYSCEVTWNSDSIRDLITTVTDEEGIEQSLTATAPSSSPGGFSSYISTFGFRPKWINNGGYPLTQGAATLDMKSIEYIIDEEIVYRSYVE